MPSAALSAPFRTGRRPVVPGITAARVPAEHGGLDMLLIADTEAIIATEGIAGPFTPDDRRAETARILEKDRKTALIASAVAAPDTGPMVIMLRASAHAPS